MILKSFVWASFLFNEINLKHLSPGFKSIHVGLGTGFVARGGGCLQGALKDSFPTSLTRSWEKPPPCPLNPPNSSSSPRFGDLPNSPIHMQRIRSGHKSRGSPLGAWPRISRSPQPKAPGTGRGEARSFALIRGGGGGGSGPTAARSPSVGSRSPRAAARLSRSSCLAHGLNHLSDTFQGWKQSIFQSDHLKHLGNYTLKISVNNSPGGCRQWERTPLSPKGGGGGGRKPGAGRSRSCVKKFIFTFKKGGDGSGSCPRAPPAPAGPAPGYRRTKHHLHKYALRVHK